MSVIRQSDLPGIGRKFQIETRSGDNLVIVVHDDGRRELYHLRHDDPDECVAMVILEDDEARQVASIIGGMAYRPKALDTVEVALDELTIEWYRVERNAPCVGKTIGELRVREQTGATIIAVIEKDHRTTISPGPERVLHAEATLVVAGERHQVRAFKHLFLQQGRP